MGFDTKGAQEISAQQFFEQERQAQERVQRERQEVQRKIDLENQFGNAHGRPAPQFTGYDQGRSGENPAGSVGPFPTRGDGFQYIGGQGGNNLHDNVWGVRYMEPNKNRGHSVTYFNSRDQSVDPQTGRTIPPSHPKWHLNPFYNK